MNTVGPDNDMTLTKLRPDDYHEIVGAREEFRIRKEDLIGAVFTDEGGIYRFLRGHNVVTPDGPGVVDGIATEDGETASDFVRVNGRLYHWTKLKHV